MKRPLLKWMSYISLVVRTGVLAGEFFLARLLKKMQGSNKEKLGYR